MSAARAEAILEGMRDTLRLTIAFEEPDEDGWIVARVVEVPGALSQGRTRESRPRMTLSSRMKPDDLG